MSESSSHLQAFLRAAHRRLVVVRTLERIGVCISIGCLMASILMPVLIWRGQSALGVALVMIGLAVFGGTVWGIAHRPSRMRAAIEADRQLDLDDLLATAWAVVTRAQDDAWARSVVTIADARCATLSPGSLILRRYGVRAWSGIGLAATVVLGVGMLSAQPLVLRAGPPDASLLGADRSSSRSGHRADTAASSVDPSIGRNEPSRSVASSPERNARGASQPVDDSNRAGAPEVSGSSGSSVGDSGSGPGESRSTDAMAPAPVRSTAAADGPPESVGAEAGLSRGTSGSLTAARGDDPSGGGALVASPTTSAPPPPPWRSSTWPQDRAAAAGAVNSGAVPDACRDLVRDYFDARPPASR